MCPGSSVFSMRLYHSVVFVFTCMFSTSFMVDRVGVCSAFWCTAASSPKYCNILGHTVHLPAFINNFFSLISLPAWAAGAIAYELFGDENPFGRDRLDSRTYQDRELPLLAQ